MMKIYLVGGAIRDELLHRPVHERDWVVVGATPEAMEKLGYKPIGKDFPVFLHPETKEEYALARTEKKVGKGYKGFTFYTSPDITLEEDLIRRDLTINAMAQDERGVLIDPFHGQTDLQNKTLKHVSDAFAEDPVRILRVARFAARFPDFSVHPDTMQLMKNMVQAGEVDALVAERVWKECSRALTEIAPLRFFEVLEQCGAAARLWPAFQLDKANQENLSRLPVDVSADARLAVLWKDLSLETIQAYADRFRLPQQTRDFILAAHRFQTEWPSVLAASPEKILEVLKSMDVFRKPERFLELVDLFVAIDSDIKRAADLADHWRKIAAAVQQISTEDLQAQGLVGLDFARALEGKRVDVVRGIIGEE